LILGVVLIIIGFGFKISMVPVHSWVPDVYEGAPTPITAYLSVGSKAAGFAIILRVFSSAFILPGNLSHDWAMVFAVLSAITMTVGNVVAIQQTNIKRLLGYSSIAQVGYIMVGLAAAGLAGLAAAEAQSAILFFLACYALTNLGAFIAIIVISNRIQSDEIKDFAGMGKRSPVTALALTLCLVSLIGIPPAAGFMAKFYIFSTAVQHDLLWLVVIAVLNSVISAYYYLRVLKTMWMDEPSTSGKIAAAPAVQVALALTALGVLVFGLVPALGLNITAIARMLGL
jgi:NADH-quinone oxidoreductase subunit N